jgi:phosphoribosylglycinamide formyltransferase-1
MSKLKVAVLISGRGSNLKALLDACDTPNFPAEIVHVISNKKTAKGLRYAEEYGVPYEVISHKDFEKRLDFDMTLHEHIKKSGAEFICLAGFMRVLSNKFVDLWKDKLVNIHPSLLPSFKGVDTHKQALEAGVKYHGCTVHFVVPDVDSGPIIVQEVIPVLDNDTEETLEVRCLEKEHIAYRRALRIIAEGKFKIEGNKVVTWG